MSLVFVLELLEAAAAAARALLLKKVDAMGKSRLEASPARIIAVLSVVLLSTPDSSEGATPAAFEETRLHVTRTALSCGPIKRLNCTEYLFRDSGLAR